MYIEHYIWNPRTCTCENDKYLGRIIGDSVIKRDEIIEATKIIPTKTISTKTASSKTIPAYFKEKKGNL